MLLSTEQQEKYAWLDDYVKAWEIAFLGSMDLSTLQPTSQRHVNPLYAAAWLSWFEAVMNVCKDKNLSFEKISQYVSESVSRVHFFFVLEDMKAARLPLDRRLRFADFFYNIMKKHFASDDVFGLRGSARTHPDSQIQEILSRNFQPGTPAVARELGKLHNAGYNLCAALYLDFYMDFGARNLGPYSLDNGRILVVKEFNNLHPDILWSEIETKAHEVVVYAIYEDVSFSTDVILCHSQYQGDLINGLVSWRLEKDGKEVTEVSEITALMENLALAGKNQWLRVKALSEPELIRKSIWIRNYCFRKLCEFLGIDWQPTQDMFDAVKGKTLAQGYATWKSQPDPTNQEALNVYWKKMWDPRIDFYP